MAESVKSDRAPEPIGPYSQAVLSGDELFCSGQVGINPGTGDLSAKDPAGQAEQTLKNLGAVLEAAGMTYANVVRTTVFLVDMNDFAAVNTVYAKFFDSTRPARSTVAVA